MIRQVKDWDIILILGLEMLNCYTINVAIYAFSSGKFLNVGVYACVNKLTNIMSDPDKYVKKLNEKVNNQTN